MQTLALIDVKNVEKTTDLIEIKIPNRIKISKINETQPTLIIPYYMKNPAVCAALTLETYINRIQELHGSENQLFIALKKPYKGISSQTLSHWIKSTFQNNDINTNIFDAYSTRQWQKEEVNIDAIMRVASWSKKSDTFARFYDCNIVKRKATFARTIRYTRQNT